METTTPGISLTKRLWIYQDYDAAGQRVKRVEQTQMNDGPYTFTFAYYVRSSVLGGAVVTELDQQGAKKLTYVYANGSVIAQQENNQVKWVHTDPVTASLRETNSNGGHGSRVEFDPLGNDVPLTDPAPPDDPTPDYLYPGTYNSSGNPYDGASGCTLDGHPLPCSLVMGFVSRGAAAQCPDNRCGARWNWEAGAFDFFHSYADGFSGRLRTNERYLGNGVVMNMNEEMYLLEQDQNLPFMGFGLRGMFMLAVVPQETSQQPPCDEQDFSFNDNSQRYSSEELSAITQTAVGEASNNFYPGEIEAVIGTIVNRQNINIAAYPRVGIFARGATQLLSPSSRGGGGILGEYDAHRFKSGEAKLAGAKINGILPANSYVCDQLKAAKDFALRARSMSPAEMKALYPFTSNRGRNRAGVFSIPRGATGQTRIGNTMFFVDAAVRWPF